MIIAVNLNGDLLGRRFASDPDTIEPTSPSAISCEFVIRLLRGFRHRCARGRLRSSPQLLQRGALTPDYFGVLANSLNIMQDYITRARLAGEPPHVLLAPRLRHITLLEFNRAKEAIAEGRSPDAEILL